MKHLSYATIPHWHCSLVAIDSHIQKIEQRGDVIYEIYSKKYAIEDKRKKYFEFLSDEEVGLMVKSVII